MIKDGQEISTLLAQATDSLLRQAADALEAAGADLGLDNDIQHALVMPSANLREVLDALSEWNMVSCAQGACESWAKPQAKAAQNVYQVVEGIFRQGADYRDLNEEASLPMLVAGESLMAFDEIRQEWANSWKPPRRMGP